MDYSQLALPDIPPVVPATPTTQPRTGILTSNREQIHPSVPDCLAQHAAEDSWTLASADEIIRKEAGQLVKNLFIPELLHKSNDPNLIFEKARAALSDVNLFAFRISTAENIKATLLNAHSRPVFIVYYLVHFVVRRVLPKLKGFRKLCRLLAIPVDMSKAEIMGRLIYKGFKIIDLVETDNETIFVAQVDRAANPSETKPAPDEGFLFTMQRIGKDGKDITVYKFRSMHPYAEYVQAYLHQTNGLDQGGKFKNDFRVSTGGRVLRKYWIDELPMIYNLVKGDIKLIGVRPISEHYFSLYPADFQAIRRKYKPGLLPPFYADMPQTFPEIVASELTYLNQYKQAPLQTDFVYLKRILKNILVHKVRSK